MIIGEKMLELVDVMKKIAEQIKDVTFMCESRTKSTLFTRNGKLGFENTICFMLNNVKKSLQIELDSFYENVLNKNYSISKQAYTQGRKKIRPEAFIKLTDTIIKAFYEEEYRKFRGYRLLAIDGTVLGINNSARLRESFGYVEKGDCHVARALGMGLYDVENDIMIASKILHYRTSERDGAVLLIEKLLKLGTKNDLIIFDRGYPSKALIEYLDNNGIKYLMRVSGMFLKKINNANKEDQTVNIGINKSYHKVRVVNFMLNEAENEKLITNLYDLDLTIDDFRKLYFKRWRIEVKYDELKNKLQIENFTGDTKETIEQDFYASMYLTNIAAIAKGNANEKLKQKNKDKKLKYEYKVNVNYLIGTLKDKFVAILLEPSPEKRVFLINKITQSLVKNVVPIRNDRHTPRNKGKRSFAHPLNQKSCL